MGMTLQALIHHATMLFTAPAARMNLQHQKQSHGELQSFYTDQK
jgi:hypothetical protein